MIRVEVLKDQTPWKCRVEGFLTIHCRLPKIDVDSQDRIVIDLQALTGIDSSGVQAWLEWIGSFPPRTDIAFENVPAHAVEALSLVQGSIPPRADLLSLAVPFYNPAHNEVEIQFFRKNVHYTAKELILPPRFVSESTSQELELDVPLHYFDFLKRFFPEIKLVTLDSQK